MLMNNFHRKTIFIRVELYVRSLYELFREKRFNVPLNQLSDEETSYSNL
jgi:hypothetical protein